MTAADIVIKDMCVKRGTFALRVDDLHISPHEVFAILGTTGSGKTVLMESIAGVFEPACGCVCIDGCPINEIKISERRIGMLYQDYALFPHMSVFENIAYGLRRHKVPEEEISKRVDTMLEVFDIRCIKDRFPGVISGGEAQRTALARALILQPRVLLLDEPFSALDPVTKSHMYEMFCAIKSEFDCTIVLVTHDFNEAQVLADRVGIVLDGELQLVCDSKDLFSCSRNGKVQRFLGLSE